jgi:hypothetical protein
MRPPAPLQPIPRNRLPCGLTGLIVFATWLSASGLAFQSAIGSLAQAIIPFHLHSFALGKSWPVKNIAANLAMLSLLLAAPACAFPAQKPAAAGPAMVHSPSPQTLSLLSPTVPPTVVAQAKATRPQATRIWMCFTCTGNQAWVLDSSSPHQMTLPITLGSYYDFSLQRNQILFAPAFADHGAGPASIAVSGLAALDLDRGVVHHMADDNVVEAYWASDGVHLAYILATPSTYELHWAIPDGEDHLLASNVTFSWSISPNSRAIAFTRESRYHLDLVPGLYVVSTGGGDPIRVSDVDKSGTGSLTDQPIWSPDSREILLPAWAGPPPARLVLARADGSESIDLHVDPALQSNRWAVDAITEVLWYPDGDRVLTLPAASRSEMGDADPLVKYQLDRTRQLLTDGEVVGEAVALIGWDQPGESVWALSYSGEVIRLTLP